MAINYISADCGAGKTHALIQQIKHTNDRYIVVQGTLQLVEQSSEQLGSIAKVITSKNHTESVEKDLHTFLLNPTHRVLVITDKAFMRITDLSLLRQWKVYLDDVVNFHTYNVINTEKKYEVEKQLFREFDKLSDQYVTAKAVTEFDDDLVQAMSNRFGFVQDYDHFVMNSSFFAKIGKAGSMDVYSTETSQLTVLAWVNIAKYSDLDITFMANRFKDTLIYKGSPELFEPVDLPGLRERTVPVSDRLKVYYFSEERFSRSYREQNPDALPKVAEWINANVTEYFYTANESNRGILNGQYIKPVSRGINAYQDYTKCVWLASMKPAPVESKQLELMFKISREEIVQAREKENLYQFVNRSNLRDYSSNAVVEVYVFDREQALSLTDNVEQIDIGLGSTSKFEPAKLSDADYKRMGKITLKRFPDIHKFDDWMNGTVNAHLNELQRQNFYKKYERLGEITIAIPNVRG